MSLAKKVLTLGCKIMGVKAYCEDNLLTVQNHEFIDDPRFARAFARGIQAAGEQYSFLRWRTHVVLWAAASASKLPGDFMECGVNKGFMSSAIMNYLGWNSLGKKFYLLDTFQGLDVSQVSEAEKAAGYLDRNQNSLDRGDYVSSVEEVKRNFSEWKDAVVVQGSIPDSLSAVTSKQIAFIHMDLNCSPPEVAALEVLWDRLVPGAYIVHDDYAQVAHKISKDGMDKFAASKGLEFVSLPTGQGLLIKPN